jgi:hypothetical protein
MFMKSFLTVMAAGGIIFTASAANATVATYTSATAYNSFAGGGTIGISDPVDWGQFSLAQGNSSVNNSTVANGSFMTTVNTEKVTAANGAGNGFTVYSNGATGGAPGTRWDGAFGNGTNVLATTSNTITLTFAGAVTGFGLDAQTSLSGAYGFTIQAYSGSATGTHTLLGTATNSVANSSGRATDAFGTAPFAGITSTAGNISYVVITATGANTGLGFAIDTSLIYHFANNNTGGGGTQTPEPGTLALLGADLAALGAVRRRRNRAA